jgi:hypothetical protein
MDNICFGVTTTGLLARARLGPQENGAAFGHMKIEGKSLLVSGLKALAAIFVPAGCTH